MLIAGAMIVMVDFSILVMFTASSDAVTVAIAFALPASGFGLVLALGIYRGQLGGAALTSRNRNGRMSCLSS